MLRICMETTRASLLWQAAAVRPEPEGMPSLRYAGAPPKYVFGVRSCFVISNAVAGKARGDAPSASRILSLCVKRWDARI